MRANDFNKMMKIESPKHILDLYCASKIYLTDKQLDTVIDKKNKLENRKRVYVVNERYAKKKPRTFLQKIAKKFFKKKKKR